VEQSRTQGVVVHLDEPGQDKHAAVLRNVTNLLDEMGPGLEVEVVAHGPGIGVCLRDNPVAEIVRDLLARGVMVAACANTMRQNGIGPDELVDRVVVVPAGVAELVRRQHSGWAYVRP
jgi:intracellular sulfur oxidation DsrE/DsrF family protein